MRKETSESKTPEGRPVFKSPTREARDKRVSDIAWLDQICRIDRARDGVVVGRDARIEHVSCGFRDVELVRRDSRPATPASAFPKGIEKYLARSISAHRRVTRSYNFATNGVTARVAMMRTGWVSFVAMYAAVQTPAVAAALDGCQPKRNAAPNSNSTSKKIENETTT